MRYLSDENPYILSRFNSGDTVTVDIYDLSTDNLVVSGASMTEVGTTGYFKYKVSLVPVVKTEYLYIASNGSDEHAGKIVLGGFPTDIKDKTDKLQFTLSNEVIATVTGSVDIGSVNKVVVSGVEDFHVTKDHLHSYLDSYSNKDLWKTSVMDIWNESAGGYTVSGTFGKLISEIKDDTSLLSIINANLVETLGLTQSNYYLDNMTYTIVNSQPLLTSGRIRIYSNSSSVGTSNDVIATYQITASWIGNQLSEYKVVKV